MYVPLFENIGKNKESKKWKVEGRRPGREREFYT
jgi:hypothetical protein